MDICEDVLEIPEEMLGDLNIFKRLNLKLCGMSNRFTRSKKMCDYFGYIALIVSIFIAFLLGMCFVLLAGEFALPIALISFSIQNIILNKIFIYSGLIKIFIGLSFAIGMALLVKSLILGSHTGGVNND